VIYGYFDDSGTHDASLVATMAGYVAHMGRWKKFERASRKLFKDEGINVFHATAFESSHDKFDGWDVARQFRFASDWYEIARKTSILQGATVSIDKASFKKAKAGGKILPNTSAYGYCLNIILQKLCADGKVWKEIQKYGLSLILEAGNPKRDEGVRMEFNRVARENNLEHVLKSLTTAPKESRRALQLGDYLAHFSWQQAEKAARGTLNARSKFHDIAIRAVPTHLLLAEDLTPNPAYRRGRRASSRGRPSCCGGAIAAGVMSSPYPLPR
jgi:hypothetical protein